MSKKICTHLELQTILGADFTHTSESDSILGTSLSLFSFCFKVNVLWISDNLYVNQKQEDRHWRCSGANNIYVYMMLCSVRVFANIRQISKSKDLKLFPPTHLLWSATVHLCMYIRSVSFVHIIFSSMLEDLFIRAKKKICISFVENEKWFLITWCIKGF